jgi:hypothetical protein
VQIERTIMAGLTKEQRAAKAEAEKAHIDPAPDQPESAGSDVVMHRDGKTAEVRKGPSVALMQALGWKLKA